ncbi:hypothetical protein Salat_0844600 [Sesamum alatum]|uniref:Uncharacterized protein n=1 Tax=Sesamum alatum TaxID=300844 RepID=A0AAE1YID8_9LAMI|nr:hypothetical protein Salat_0844600 [Sesamum alatum]
MEYENTTQSSFYSMALMLRCSPYLFDNLEQRRSGINVQCRICGTEIASINTCCSSARFHVKSRLYPLFDGGLYQNGRGPDGVGFWVCERLDMGKNAILYGVLGIKAESVSIDNLVQQALRKFSIVLDSEVDASSCCV